ncbi:MULTISPECIES: SecDF P1 head subdomain-containing protein [Marinobacter]|jgi:preprotein translocase subunit SecD|uniref:SecDF P1 head subdomain-containing protein n=1 Tax=Marinobacter TaxID=2742 RepID=UPI000774E1FA
MKWIAILLLVTPGIVVAETELEFHLCSAYVEQSAVGAQTESGWPVRVKLTQQGATSFERFTEANIGRMSRLVVGDREFFRATMWVPISSGSIYGAFSSQEAAIAWQRTLAGKLPAAPCGAGD